MTQNETRQPIMKIRNLTKEFKIKSKNWAPSPRFSTP